jgi:hypothetical protein
MRTVTMSKQEAKQLIKQLKAYQRKATVDRRTALAALKRAGLVTEDGRPAQFYAPSPKTNSSKR